MPKHLFYFQVFQVTETVELVMSMLDTKFQSIKNVGAHCSSFLEIYLVSIKKTDPLFPLIYSFVCGYLYVDMLQWLNKKMTIICWGQCDTVIASDMLIWPG